MAYGYTATLPTITGSRSDFHVLLTNGSFPAAAIDGGGTSILNGGGNLRAYTDSTKTTQLPVEIVNFVTGGSPSIQVWIKLPTASTAATIFIEADSVAISQPAVTDTYGRNAVWSAVQSKHNLASLIDSAGSYDLTTVGSPTAGVADPFGGNSAYEFSGSGQYLKISSWARVPDNNILSFWYRCDLSGTNKVPLSQGNLSSTSVYDGVLFRNGNVYEVLRTGTGSGLNGGSIKATWTMVHVHLLSGSNKVYENGVLVGTNSQVFGSGTVTDMLIGALARSSSKLEFDGAISSVYWSDTLPSSVADYVATEYANQSDPDNWLTVGSWVDSASGISVTESPVNTNYTSNNPTILLTGSINITESIVNTNYASNNPTVTLTGVISVTESLVNVNYDSLDPVIDFTGLVSIQETLVNSDYATLNPVITLTSGAVSIIESVVNTQYTSKNPSILLTPPPIGIVSTVCFNGELASIEYNGTVTDLSFNGGIESLVYNGTFNDLQFNGTIKTTCNTGSIKTNC